MQKVTIRTFMALKGITPVIFLGLCIKTGSLLISLIVSLFVQPAASRNLYMGLDLSALFTFGKMHYMTIAGLMILQTGLKAWMCFDLLRILSALNLEQPFSERVYRLIRNIGRTALVTGILAVVADKYGGWVMRRGIPLPIEWAEEEILLFAAILMVIAHVFSRGIELEREQALTI